MAGRGDDMSKTKIRNKSTKRRKIFGEPKRNVGEKMAGHRKKRSGDMKHSRSEEKQMPSRKTAEREQAEGGEKGQKSGKF